MQKFCSYLSIFGIFTILLIQGSLNEEDESIYEGHSTG